MNEMKKGDFVDFLYKEYNCTKGEAQKSLDMVTDGIQKVLKDNKLNITGFGTFYITYNKAREGRNPKTGEKMKISASKSVRFKAGATLKKACN